jgi:hypothetical protein
VFYHGTENRKMLGRGGASVGIFIGRGATRTVVINGTPQKYHRGLTKKNGSRDRALEQSIRDGGLGI